MDAVLCSLEHGFPDTPVTSRHHRKCLKMDLQHFPKTQEGQRAMSSTKLSELTFSKTRRSFYLCGFITDPLVPIWFSPPLLSLLTVPVPGPLSFVCRSGWYRTGH